MAKIRIYELAKELGLENKAIIAKAQEIGMRDKKSHSNSLSDEEADLIRRAMIREAIGTSPDSEVVRTRVDRMTGEERTIVERRKGDVVRRRRSLVDENDTVVRRRPQEEEAPADQLSDDDIFRQPDATDLFAEEHEEERVNGGEEELAAASEAEAAEEIHEEEHLQAEEETLEATSDEEAEEELLAEADEESAEIEEEVLLDSASEAASLEPEIGDAGKNKKGGKKAKGPRVVGKIALPQEKEKKAKPARTEKRKAQPEWEQEDTEGKKEQGGRGKKRSRKREFTRGDLVDYEGRSGRGKKGKRSREMEDLEDGDYFDDEQLAGTQEMKASKRVIKMSEEVITVGELAHQMSLKAADIIKKLFELGVLATINQVIDTDTATILSEEFGYKIEFTGFDEVDVLQIEGIDDETKMESRPPIVTVMGHVDHGKTSLLDYIRSASVADKEHGGITQHIGAYSVTLDGDRTITFIDTPGHAAFTSMRARGAEVTDIVILVVAADDGVMPQTIEAINHAKAAGVNIIVAVNKMDKPEANPDLVKTRLSELGLQPEEWGGDTLFYPVSALKGTGIEELLEGVLLVAELKELKANPECRVKGTILEARQEKGLGTVATVLVQHGTLRIGNIFVSGGEFGRIRSMSDFRGNSLKEAKPSTPVEITGLQGVPVAGDDFIVVENDATAKQVASNRKEVQQKKDQLALAGGPVSLEEFARRASAEEVVELNLIIKSDVHGSLEAVKEAVEKLHTEKVKVKVIHGAVGGVNESDVQLAIASKALIVGFNVRGEPRALNEAESHGIEVRFYRVIYELLDDVKQGMAGLLAPVKEEHQIARVEVRDTFSVPKVGTVAGCYVLNGTVKRGAKLRLLRDNVVVHEGDMLALRRFKDDVKEVSTGYECGISFAGYNDLKHGDVIEVFEIRERAATLE